METDEKFIGITSSYKVGDPGSQVLVILEKARDILRIDGKTYFYLKVDDKGRLIYEPLSPQPVHHTDAHKEKPTEEGVEKS